MCDTLVTPLTLPHDSDDGHTYLVTFEYFAPLEENEKLFK